MNQYLPMPTSRRFRVSIATVAFFLVFIGAAGITCAQSYRGEKPEWVLQVGGPNDDVSSWQIVVDQEGNAIVAGSFREEITIGSKTLFTTGRSDVDAFVAKISPLGNVLWAMKISGAGDERISLVNRPPEEVWDASIYSSMTVNNTGQLYLSFWSTSKSVNVGDTVLDFQSVGGGARFVSLASDGKVLWHLDEPYSWGSIFSSVNKGEVCIVDNQKTRNTGNGSIRFVTPTGVTHRALEVKSSAFDPYILAIASGGKDGTFYGVSLFGDNQDSRLNVTTLIGDTSITIFKGDIALVVHDSLGKTKWINTVSSLGNESPNTIQVQNDTVFMWGSTKGWDGSVNLSYPLEFTSTDGRGVTLKRTMNTGNTFLAKYTLDGHLISVDWYPFFIGYHGWLYTKNDFQIANSDVLLSAPNNGLWTMTGELVSQFYAGMTYSLSSICGSHYLLGDFSDTLKLDRNRFPIVSRGGKDIFLALMKPPEKYVPVRPGSRFPLDNSVDLDIPVRTEWWPVSCANGYRFQLSRDSAMNSVVFDTVMSLDPFLNLDLLEPLTKYYWRLRANTSDTFSVWSDTRSFTTVKAQPADVVLEYPANDSKGVTRGVTLRWQASKRATSYLLDVATDSVFTNKVINGQLVTGTTVDVTLPGKKTCYWRVRAANSSGSSPWSPVWKFDTRPNKPERTILDQPVDAAQGEPRNVLLGWKSQGEDIRYKLQIARDDAFAFIEAEKTVTDAFWRAMLEGNTKYYWRVNASNGFEDAEWSPVWSFTTSSTTDVYGTELTRDLTAIYIDGAILVHINNEKLLNQDMKIALYELSGREVMSARTRLDGSPLRIAVPNLSVGVYQLVVGEGGGGSQSFKIVVR